MLVAMPALHISLGIFDRLYKLYEDACHELDVRLAATKSAPVQATDTFMQYAEQIQEKRKMAEKMEECLNKTERYEDLPVQLIFFHEQGVELEGEVRAIQAIMAGRSTKRSSSTACNKSLQLSS